MLTEINCIYALSRERAVIHLLPWFVVIQQLLEKALFTGMIQQHEKLEDDRERKNLSRDSLVSSSSLNSTATSEMH